jgi:peptidyl-prolyl cis-trans isomerase SurA
MKLNPMNRFVSLLLVGFGICGLAQAQQTLDRVVAVVNSDVITSTELASRVNTVKRQTRRQSVELPPDDELRRQILDRLVLERVLLLAAKERGVTADDRQVDETVARIADENKLAPADFRARVERDGVSFARFREEIRNEITLQRLREREADSRVQISEAEITAFLAKQATNVAVEYNVQQILLTVPEAGDVAAADRQRVRAEELVRQLQRGVDFARLANSFSESPDAPQGGVMGFRSPERLPQLFVEAVKSLRPGELAAIQKSANGYHILKLIDKRSSAPDAVSTAPVEQTRARHILIRLNEVVLEADALRRLKDIRDRVVAGSANFAEMAKQYSSDGNAATGGDLGWVYPGDTVPEFERAMNTLKVGEISEPVRTAYGFHLLQVTERRKQEASEDRQRQAARVALRERKGVEAFDEWVRELRARAFVELRLEE